MDLIAELLVYGVLSCHGDEPSHEYLLLVTPTGVGSEEKVMDKDRIKSSATGTGGKIKQAAGDMTSDSKLQSEGQDSERGRQCEGRAQEVSFQAQRDKSPIRISRREGRNVPIQPGFPYRRALSARTTVVARSCDRTGTLGYRP